MIFFPNYIVTLPRAGLSMIFFSVFPRGPRTITEYIRSGYRKGENIEIFSKMSSFYLFIPFSYSALNSDNR